MLEIAELLGEYWASPSHDEERYFEHVLKRETEFYQAVEQYNLFPMCRLAYGTYYGLSSEGAWQSQTIRFVGEAGEKAEYQLNEFRSFADQIFNMTTKNRPSFQAQAINTDAESTGQVEASDSVIKFYYEQVFGERKEREVVKCEGLYGKAYTYIDWDPDDGPEVEVDEPIDDPNVAMLPPEQQTVRKKVRAGAFDIRRLYWWQVSCDPFKSEHDKHLFRIVNIPRNRYDMIARYPLYARVISNTGSAKCAYADRFPGFTMLEDNPDNVTVRVVLHIACGTLPQGRKSIFVGEKMVEDGPLPIEDIPLVDFMSGELDGTCFGMSDLWNIIPCQQMNNQLLSNFATNVEAFGCPPLAMFGGAEPTIDELANGQKLVMLDSPDHMPQVIQYPSISEAHLRLLEMNRKFPQSMTGLNGVSRGESDDSVKSGTHAALYHAMAVEAQSPRAVNLDIHRERVTNILLQYLKAYAKHPQLVAIAGQDERPYMKYFGQKDIAGVHRVVVKTNNALLNTTAGRMSVAETLRDWPGNPIKDPQQIIELITTGQFKPMTSPAHTSSMRAKRENELLAMGPEVVESDGPPDPMTGMPTKVKKVPSVPPFPTDGIEHFWSILELLAQPDTVNNPKKMDAAMTHLEEHIELWRNNDPYLAMLGQSTIPAPMQAPQQDPESGKKGPSDDDMDRVQEMAPPAKKPAMDQQDDSQSAMGRLPKPAQPAGLNA